MKEKFNGLKASIIICLLIICSIFAGCTKSTEQQLQEQLELGQRYLAEANYEEAIVVFNKVIELDPNNADAYMYLGQTYLEKAEADTGDISIVVSDYNASIEALLNAMELGADVSLDDSLARAYIGVADAYLALGDIEAAKQMAEAGREYMGEDAYVNCLEKIQESSGETLIAETQFIEETETEPVTIEIETLPVTEAESETVTETLPAETIPESQPETTLAETTTAATIAETQADPMPETAPAETTVPETVAVSTVSDIKIDPQVFNLLSNSDGSGYYSADLALEQVFLGFPAEGCTVKELGDSLSRYIGSSVSFSWDRSSDSSYFSEVNNGLCFTIGQIEFVLQLDPSVDFYQYAGNWNEFLNTVESSIIYPNGGGFWSGTIYVNALGSDEAECQANIVNAANSVPAANASIQ